MGTLNRTAPPEGWWDDIYWRTGTLSWEYKIGGTDSDSDQPSDDECTCGDNLGHDAPPKKHDISCSEEPDQAEGVIQFSEGEGYTEISWPPTTVKLLLMPDGSVRWTE